MYLWYWLNFHLISDSDYFTILIAIIFATKLAHIHSDLEIRTKSVAEKLWNNPNKNVLFREELRENRTWCGNKENNGRQARWRDEERGGERHTKDYERRQLRLIWYWRSLQAYQSLFIWAQELPVLHSIREVQQTERCLKSNDLISLVWDDE